MSKAENIFVRAAAYRKKHPRTSMPEAVKIVSKQKVSGIRKPKAKVKAKAVAAPKRAKRPRISGPKKVAVSTSTRGDKNVNLLRLGEIINRRIDRAENKLKGLRGRDERKLLITFINGEHDKLDKVMQSMKAK